MNDISKINSEELLNYVMSNNFPEVFENFKEDDLESQISIFINELIDNDFNRLIHLIYRIDISEEKLKLALQKEDKSQSSGKTIAKLIVERQLQKLKFRQQFSKKKIE